MTTRLTTLPSEESAFYQFFCDSREAMYVTSRDGVFLAVNRAFEELLGYHSGELDGQLVSTILESEDDREQYRNIIESDGVVHEYPLALKRRDGGLLLSLIDAVVWRKDGAIAGYHGIVRTKHAVIEAFRSFMNRLKEEKIQIREERKNLIADTMLLSKYMTDDLLEFVTKTGRNPLETGRTRVTILFFDIRNSTGIAEKVGSEDFAGFLSDILTDIMDLIYGCKGSVNKLLGDGLMATFGAPLSTGDDAANAVEAARRIREYLRTFNDVRPDFLVDEIAAGVGIATGPVFAGVIGSIRRQEYTVVGDPVNIASRLESLTKTTGQTILVDEETYAEVKDRFPLRPIAKGRVRGRTEVIRVYGLDETGV